MVQIHCTQKLGKFIKANIEKGLPRAGNDWSAHLFFVSGRKCIIVVHKKTLYTVMLFDIFKKEMSYINRLFLEALIDQLISDNLLGNHEAFIRDLYKEISFVSTDNDKKTLGVINNIVSIYQGHFENLESARLHASEGVNKMPWQSIKYAYSKDLMLKELNLIG